MAQQANKVEVIPSEHQIRDLTKSDEDCEKLWQMWQTIFPKWPIEHQRLQRIIQKLSGLHYIHENGFCLSFLEKGVHGRIAAVGVLPDYRCKGLGGAFLEKAHTGLKNAARAEGSNQLESFQIGSTVPRFWPQMPMDLPQEVKDFFIHRGFKKSSELGCRDLYKDIRTSVVPPEVLERVAKTNIKFAPWSAEKVEECLEKQKANFSWWRGYEVLAAYGQFGEVMVAFDPETDVQIGWTFMCSQSAIICDMYSFLPLLPAKEKTGLIAAVGIDPNVRSKGIGLAMVVKAMESLKARGMEGILVDSTWLRGFYEKAGFETYWEYEEFQWEEPEGN